MSKNTVSVNTQNWDEQVLHSEVPVLVDFWAPWCAPCRMIGPSVDELAAEFSGRAKIVKVNVDEDPELASRYGVHTIPNLMVFRGGRVVEQRAGALPKAGIARLLEAQLASESAPLAQ
jgi:thioredoxin 1